MRTIKSVSKSFAMTSILALSALTLSACGSDSESEITSGEPLATVEAPAGTQWSDTVVKSEENGYVIGNPDAPIKLIEYASLTCGACAAFEQEAYAELISDYVSTGRVSLEIRNYLLNPYDIVLGVLTRCGAPETYPALTEQVFKNQSTLLDGVRNIDQATLEKAFGDAETKGYGDAARAMGVMEFFKARGISEDQANACLADPAMAKELLDITEKGTKEYKIEGTPSFFINGAKVDYSGWANLKGKLQEAGAR